MAQRLTQAEAEELRGILLKAIARDPQVFQSAREWQESGLDEYSVAQIKRQLEILVRAGKVKANRGAYAVFYGAVES